MLKTSSASSNPNAVTATVNFINQTNDVSIPTTLPANVSVTLDPDTLEKSYIPIGATDPLPGKVSVLDCVLAAVGNHSKTLGWDDDPLYGNPGAWIDDIFGFWGKLRKIAPTGGVKAGLVL